MSAIRLTCAKVFDEVNSEGGRLYLLLPHPVPEPPSGSALKGAAIPPSGSPYSLHLFPVGQLIQLCG
jgi:hypothetical protein